MRPFLWFKRQYLQNPIYALFRWVLVLRPDFDFFLLAAAVQVRPSIFFPSNGNGLRGIEEEQSFPFRRVDG